MWERFLRWPHHYLPPPSSRRSICRADSEPDRTTLQLLSIISWRGCSYNLAIVSRATLLSPPSSASLLVQPPHYPVLSPAFSPLSSLFPPLPSPFHARNLGKQSKRRSRERERELEERAKISWKPDEESEERLQWRGVVRRNDDERNRSFRQRMKIHEADYSVSGIGGGALCDAELDSWPIESCRYWASGWWNGRAIGDWWFVEAKVAMDVVRPHCVCRISNWVSANVWQFAIWEGARFRCWTVLNSVFRARNSWFLSFFLLLSCILVNLWSEGMVFLILKSNHSIWTFVRDFF